MPIATIQYFTVAIFVQCMYVYDCTKDHRNVVLHRLSMYHACDAAQMPQGGGR